MLNKDLLNREMTSLMVNLIKTKTFARDDKLSADQRVQKMAEAISEAVSKTVIDHIQKFLEVPATGTGTVTGTGTGQGTGVNGAGPVISVVNTSVVGTAVVTVPLGGFK